MTVTEAQERVRESSSHVTIPGALGVNWIEDIRNQVIAIGAAYNTEPFALVLEQLETLLHSFEADLEHKMGPSFTGLRRLQP